MRSHGNEHEATDMIEVTVTKTKEAQPMGEYKPTAIDVAKAAADFRIVQVGPYVIVWKDGRTERVNARQLKKLQEKHTFATDF
jgi:hypothetical protein